MDTIKPFKICFDETLGRHLVATNTINVGDVILQEVPLVRGPFLQTVPVCLVCGQILTESTNKPCPECGWPLCSEKCFSSTVHNPECEFTQNKGSKISIRNFGITHPNYQCITILRCLKLKETHPEKWRQLLQLQSQHTDSDEFLAGFVLKFFKLENCFSHEEILKVIGILSINGHEIPLTNPPQVAIYQVTSMLEHNCRANCAKTFSDDGEILLIAAEKISAGEHLSICYTEPLWGTHRRRLHLKTTKNFSCCCRRCQDPSEFQTNFSSIKCQNKSCKNGNVLPNSFLNPTLTDPWQCSDCSEIMPITEIAEILARIQLDASKIKNASVLEFKNFINKSEQLLNINHYLLIDVKITLVQILAGRNLLQLSDKDLNLKMELSEHLLEIISKIAPAERRLRAMLLFELAMGSMEHKKRTTNNNEGLNKNRKLLEECCELLENEPPSIPESKIFRKAKMELKEMENTIIM